MGLFFIALKGKVKKLFTYLGYSPCHRIKLLGLSFESNLSDVSRFMFNTIVHLPFYQSYDLQFPIL